MLRVFRSWPAERSSVCCFSVSLVALGLLAACSTTPPSGATYDLQVTSALSAAPTAVKPQRSLTVAEPVALAALESDRIAVRDVDGRLAYLVGAQWADRLPRLVQVRVLRHLEDAGYLSRVGRTSDRFQGQDVLSLDLRRFEFDVLSQGVVVEVAAKLSDERSGQLKRGRVFVVTLPSSSDPTVVARQLTDALAQVLQQMSSWVFGVS